MFQAGFTDKTFKRRSYLKNDIQTDYKALCEDSNPVTDWLVGDNIKDTIKEIDAEQGAFKKASKENHGYGQKRGKHGFHGHKIYGNHGNRFPKKTRKEKGMNMVQPTIRDIETFQTI